MTSTRSLTIDEAIKALQDMREIAGGKTPVGAMQSSGGGHGDPGWLMMVGFTHADLHHENWHERDSDGQMVATLRTWARFA